MSTQRIALLIVLLGAIFAFGVVVFGTKGGSTERPDNGSQAAVASMVDGVQYIDIQARGGYAPRTTKAKANTASVLRVTTENTYDCSSSLVVPSLDYREFLKPTGTVEIPIPADKAIGTLEGLCSMGMYRFEVVFE